MSFYEDEFLMENPPPEVHAVEYFFDLLHAWCGYIPRDVGYFVRDDLIEKYENTGDASTVYTLFREHFRDDDDPFGGMLKLLRSPFEGVPKMSSPIRVVNPGLIALVYKIQENTLVNHDPLEDIPVNVPSFNPDLYNNPDPSEVPNAYRLAFYILQPATHSDPIYRNGKDQLEVLGLPFSMNVKNRKEVDMAAYDHLLLAEIPFLLEQILNGLDHKALDAYIKERTNRLTKTVPKFVLQALIQGVQGKGIEMLQELRDPKRYNDIERFLG